MVWNQTHIISKICLYSQRRPHCCTIMGWMTAYLEAPGLDLAQRNLHRAELAGLHHMDTSPLLQPGSLWPVGTGQSQAQNT